MIFLAIVATVITVMCAYYLVDAGNDGGYDDLFVGIVLHALFVGSFCVIFLGFGIFQITWLYIGIGLSFALFGIGYINQSNLFYNPEVAKEKQIRKKIKKTQQYKEYKAFVKANGMRIGAVMTDFNVLYAPKGVPFFTEHGKDWNPELGNPATHFYSDERPDQGWQRKTFFQVMKGEDNWTDYEKQIIIDMMIKLLPGIKSGKWNIAGEAIRKLPH